MPTSEDRKDLQFAIKNKDSSKLHEFLKRDDAKELLLMKYGEGGYLPIHDACRLELDKSCFQLFLDTAVEHEIIKKMLEEKDKYGRTCLHLACVTSLSTDSLRLLLEYVSKYAYIKKMLEEKFPNRWTCLHYACSLYVFTDSLRLIISFFPSKEVFENALAAKDFNDKTPIDCANNKLAKNLLQDPDCFKKCRLWLLQNHEDTFLYSLHHNCRVLQEVTETSLQHCRQTMIMLIALMSSPSKFREAVDKTDSSAPMSNYFYVVKKGDEKSDYHHWRKNIHCFREFYRQWPPNDRKTATTAEGSSCVLQ